MAKVSLRIYNQEIENLVDRGQLDEAIAHCRHVLNTFPKYLEAYRLIGKAYLEAKRYDEATDIFERLLMAVPDDFVAHVGMSIMHDEQKSLDAAIWHMERAFEVQPSNAAIQAELQRLYGRRDGIEPPKIRLTRGALAHMYVQGELYPQAISEIKSVLEEDPERHDMQVLLARAYFHAGQKNESADMCSQLLRRYPYCFDANRVLVELLPEAEHGESVQVYRKRVDEMDPYTAHVTGSVFQVAEVPDSAVSMERLEWDGQPVDVRSDWGESQGIGRDEGATASSEQPDWLKSAMMDETSAASDSTEEPAPAMGSEEIPDFLREAGWEPGTGAGEEEVGIFDESEESPAEPGIEQGDLPDWVKAMAPTGMDIQAAGLQPESPEDLTQDDVPDWLQGLGDAQSEPSAEQPLTTGEDLPDWLESMKPTEGAEVPTEEQPVAAAASDEALPDWLESMESAQEEVEAPTEEQPMAAPASDEDLPDWLTSKQTEEEQAAPQVSPQEISQEPAEEVPVVEDESLSDWLPGEETPAEEAAVEQTGEPVAAFDSTDTGELGTSAEEQDDAIAWLEGLASKHGAKPEELVTKPEDRKEAEPDWVQQVKGTGAEEPQVAVEEPLEEMAAPAAQPETLEEASAEQSAEPVAEFDSTDTGELGTSAEEQDDAIAWLEGLASKHGAKPEELVTEPENRKEEEPDWVRQAKEVEATSPPVEEKPGEPVVEEPVAPASADETGMWLRDLGEEDGFLEEEVEGAEGADQPVMEGDLPDWLEGLDSEEEEPGAAPEMEVAPVMEGPPETEATPEPAEEAESELPEWLQSTEAESTTETEAAPAMESPPEVETTPEPAEEAEAELPEWLQGVEEESTTEAKPPEVEATPAPVEEETVLSGKLDINTSSVDELAKLPGIGELLAQNIVAHRETYGEFSSIDELGEIAGIGPATVEEVRDLVEVSLVEVDLNTAPVERLAKLPGIGDYLARNIVAHRELHGGFSSVEELEEIDGIGPATIDDLRERIVVSRVITPAQPEEPVTDDWLSGMESEPVEASAGETSVEEAPSEELPSWLAGLEEETEQPGPAAGSQDELPEWLRMEEEEPPAEPEPTTPTDWQPADKAKEPPAPKAEEKPAPEPPTPTPVESKPEPSAPPEREAYREPVTRSRSGMTGMLSMAKDPALTAAQNELTRGNIPGAIDSYGKLIKKGKLLDEIIFDLREALYRYPVEVAILQALGDAYMRANRLQEALDSYTKAEELLR